MLLEAGLVALEPFSSTMCGGPLTQPMTGKCCLTMSPWWTPSRGLRLALMVLLPFTRTASFTLAGMGACWQDRLKP